MKSTGIPVLSPANDGCPPRCPHTGPQAGWVRAQQGLSPAWRTGVAGLGWSVMAQLVADEQVADEQVADEQVADEQVADEQVADEQVAAR
jgi:hypothetical protein